MNMYIAINKSEKNTRKHASIIKDISINNNFITIILNPHIKLAKNNKNKSYNHQLKCKQKNSFLTSFMKII